MDVLSLYPSGIRTIKISILNKLYKILTSRYKSRSQKDKAKQKLKYKNGAFMEKDDIPIFQLKNTLTFNYKTMFKGRNKRLCLK